MELSTGELTFLRYLDGSAVGGSYPNYFKYSHGIDPQECVSRFYAEGLVEYASIEFTLSRHSVAELKDAAAQIGMSIKQKKRADIIEELLNNASTAALEGIFPDKYYSLTPAGKATLENLSEEEYANRYEPPIKVDEIKHAMQLINAPDQLISYIQTNIGENIRPLHSAKETIENYLKKDDGLSEEEKAFFIVLAICGSRHERATRAYKKIFGSEKTAAFVYTQLRIVKSTDELISCYSTAIKIKDSGMKYVYRIHTSDDASVCEFCRSIKDKEFDFLEAKIGINYPPFNSCKSEFCRCRASASLVKK